MNVVKNQHCLLKALLYRHWHICVYGLVDIMCVSIYSARQVTSAVINLATPTLVLNVTRFAP